MPSRGAGMVIPGSTKTPPGYVAGVKGGGAPRTAGPAAPKMPSPSTTE